MRKRPCPKRLGAGTVAGLVVAGLILAATVGLRAQGEKGIVSDRLDRVREAQTEQQTAQKADTETWTAAKIVINLDARCPVITALGYFGAFATTDTDPAKATELQSRFAKLQAAVRPLADEIKKMATTNTFSGRKFPVALRPRLNVMCADLYGEILKLYGDEALAELKHFVSTQAQGVYVPD